MESTDILNVIESKRDEALVLAEGYETENGPSSEACREWTLRAECYGALLEELATA